MSAGRDGRSSAIRVEALGCDTWLVTVAAAATTEHRVRVSPADVARFGVRGSTAENLLDASFRFLLEREPNTSILTSFDLPVIATYFPEYPRELQRLLGETA